MNTGVLRSAKIRDAASWPKRLLVHVMQLDSSQPMAATLSIGIARIAIFSSTLWVYFIVREAMAGGDVVAYAKSLGDIPFYRFGLLRLWMPGPDAWGVIDRLALFSTLLAIIGLLTRPAMIVSVLTTTMLASLDAGRGAFWSAPYNVIFLAGLAIMFGRADASISLDRLVRRVLPRYPLGRIEPHQTYLLAWPVLLAQAAVALFYFGAFFTKAVQGGFWYIFSDNLRNALAITWTAPKEFVIPWFVELIWSHPVLWIGALLGHMVMQLLPATAILFPRRPLLRAFEALVFAGGVIALREIMTVWNPWWIPLAVLFIDWDWLFRRSPPVSVRSGSLPTFPLVLGAIFLGYYCLQIVGQRGRTDLAYPFDNFDMYAGTYATRPYTQHLPYAYPYGDVSIRTPTCDISGGRWVNVTGKSRDELKAIYSPISRKATTSDPLFYRCENGESRITQLPDNLIYYGADNAPAAEYRQRLEATRVFIEQMPANSELRLWGRFMIYPAYPASPMPFDAHRALRAILKSDGTYLAARPILKLETPKQPYLTIDQVGLDGATWKFRYRSSHWKGQSGPLMDLPGKWVGDRYYYEVEAGPKPYSIVLVTTDPKTGEELEFYGPHIYT
ncbi:MAG: hypothetical protein J0I42_15075 [Bosea sp.]|uniref:hypothetical protein n=1 Tax=Bosea sp. (in: a-proteobacteria) TaxID=1871050 RepID=UPI001AD5BA04|nr:hypothetical protein [Bosea sp. (in: a-proteobacteria)]MBN9453269.1 hypothetical protein [Bosea sp. (in: a-proteobacteria)]